MNQEQILELIDELMQRLEGEWVLLGGSLLSYLKLSDRQTFDIDLAPCTTVTNQVTLKAIDIATKKGLPPETINFAVEFFLKKQRNWRQKNLNSIVPAKNYSASLKKLAELKPILMI